MNRIDKLIDDFINDYTVSENSTISKSICRTYCTRWNPETRKDEIFIDFRRFDRLTMCKFLVYNGKRLIQKKYKNQPHRFVFLEDYSAPGFYILIGKILELEVRKDYNGYNEGTIPLAAAKEAIEHFGLDVNLGDYAHYIENNNTIVVSGDYWDYSWDEFFTDSSLFQSINDKLKELLQVEIAPYRKYNPNFNPRNYLDELEDLDKVVDSLTLEELLKVLTTAVFDYDGDPTLCDKFGFNKTRLSKLDKNSLKQVLGVLDDSKKKSFVYYANELYNL